MMLFMRHLLLLLAPLCLAAAGLTPLDLLRLRAVGDVALSPDGRRIATRWVARTTVRLHRHPSGRPSQALLPALRADPRRQRYRFLLHR